MEAYSHTTVLSLNICSNWSKHAIGPHSSVESEPPVSKCDPETGCSQNGEESAMVLGSPLPDVLVSSIAEWGIGRHLTVAELVVA